MYGVQAIQARGGGRWSALAGSDSRRGPPFAAPARSTPPSSRLCWPDAVARCHGSLGAGKTEQPGQALASQPGVGTREASGATRSRMIAFSPKGPETSPTPQQRRRPYRSSVVIYHRQNDLLDLHWTITLLSHSLLRGLHMLLLPIIGCLLLPN